MDQSLESVKTRTAAVPILLLKMTMEAVRSSIFEQPVVNVQVDSF